MVIHNDWMMRSGNLALQRSVAARSDMDVDFRPRAVAVIQHGWEIPNKNRGF